MEETTNPNDNKKFNMKQFETNVEQKKNEINEALQSAANKKVAKTRIQKKTKI